MESNRQAHLELPDGRRIALQEVRGVYGASGYDVSSLYRREGVLLYDPGFQSTASCRSAVSACSLWACVVTWDLVLPSLSRRIAKKPCSGTKLQEAPIGSAMAYRPQNTRSAR